MVREVWPAKEKKTEGCSAKLEDDNILDTPENIETYNYTTIIIIILVSYIP